jgi:hypothetical protein
VMAMGNSITQSYASNGETYVFKDDGGPGGSSDREPALIALLGGEQPYRELVRTFDSRNITGDLAAAGVDESVPLTAVQARQMAQIIADNSPSYRQGGNAGAASINWDGVEAQAQGLLSPAQQAVLAEERRQIQFTVAMRTTPAAPAQ